MFIKNLIPFLFAILLVNPGIIKGQTNLEEVINDMTLTHEGRPHGVPSSFNWAIQPRIGAETPPENWDAAISWGQLYEWIEGNPSENTRVQIRDLELHYLSKSDLQWHQLQVSVKVDGAAYVEDFAGDVNKPADKRNESDGSVSVTCGDGYNFHFWPVLGRVKYPKNDVKGCYVTVRARLIMDDPLGEDDRESARYLMSVGGDWWESLTAVWDNWTTNWDMGIGRFRFVTSEWQSYNMITLPEDSIRKYPPPFHPEIGTDNYQKGIIPTKNIKIQPNPVASNATLLFSNQKDGRIKISIWNSEGRFIQYIENNIFSAGEYEIAWNSENLKSGFYFIKLEKNSQNEYLKFMVL